MHDSESCLFYILECTSCFQLTWCEICTQNQNHVYCPTRGKSWHSSHMTYTHDIHMTYTWTLHGIVHNSSWNETIGLTQNGVCLSLSNILGGKEFLLLMYQPCLFSFCSLVPPQKPLSLDQDSSVLKEQQVFLELSMTFA